MILRLLGLHPDQMHFADSPGGLQHWFYRSPFDHVICSMDGSGVDYYLPKLISPGVPRSVWLNGVDSLTPDAGTKARILDTFPETGPPVVLFVGRLEWNKGCREFIEAALAVLERRPGAIRAVVIGEGGLRDELENRVSAAGADFARRCRDVGG